MFVESYDWDTSILEEHLEEIEALWYVHTQALRSSNYRFSELQELQSRIAAHVDGVVRGGTRSVDAVIERLTTGDAGMKFAACLILLRMGSDHTQATLLGVLAAVDEDSANALEDAFCASKLDDDWVGRMRQMLQGGESLATAVAARILAFHGLLHESNVEWVTPLLLDENPAVRKRGWEVIALTGIVGVD